MKSSVDPNRVRISSRRFGVSNSGLPVELYELSNHHGMQASIAALGGIVTSLIVPDRHGVSSDVVLGFDDLDGYLAGHPYFGAIVGRYANRIANGSFDLDGHTYELARNNGQNHLHGGEIGFDKALWTASPRSGPTGSEVHLTHISEDGDEGFPGRLELSATYTLTAGNELRIDYRATTDKPTIINLTNHSYFNLAGHDHGEILDHELLINADRFTPVDADLIPTGECREVAGTPMDFRRSTTIGAGIDSDDEQLLLAGGYDHSWVLTGEENTLRLAATARDPASGRVMDVFTTEPGVQFYTANFLDGSLTGKGGIRYNRRCALCLETQHFPDSPNRAEFPTTVLRPGEEYSSTTIYSFRVDS